MRTTRAAVPESGAIGNEDKRPRGKMGADSSARSPRPLCRPWRAPPSGHPFWFSGLLSRKAATSRIGQSATRRCKPRPAHPRQDRLRRKPWRAAQALLPQGGVGIAPPPRRHLLTDSAGKGENPAPAPGQGEDSPAAPRTDLLTRVLRHLFGCQRASRGTPLGRLHAGFPATSRHCRNRRSRVNIVAQRDYFFTPKFSILGRIDSNAFLIV